MKNMFLKCTIFLSIMFLANLTFAQDMIILKTGDEIKSKVLEITPDLVKYKKWENLDGPIYSSNKSAVFMIKYSNGTKDVFKTASIESSNSVQTSIFNNGDKFIGTWIYPKGANDHYRIYKIVITKNGEDFLFNTENGNGGFGIIKRKEVGKLVGSSIELNALEKASLIENGTKLLLYEREYIKSSYSQQSSSDNNVVEPQSNKTQSSPIKKSKDVTIQNNRVCPSPR